MYKKHQKCVILFIFICVGMIFFCGEDSGALTVGIRLVPNRTNIPVDFEHISLTADVIPPSTITYQWNLYGPGAFDGSQTEQSIVYIPPKEIDGQSAKGIVTVTVTDEMGQKTISSVTFTIASSPTSTFTPTPTPTSTPTPIPTSTPTPTSTSTGISKTKVAIGVGAAAALGVAIALMADNDDGDEPGCEGKEIGNYCWYLGAEGQSCDIVCASHGDYHEATRTYVGSDGTDNDCYTVLSAWGAPVNIDDKVTTEPMWAGLGCCYWFYEGRARWTRDDLSPTTSRANYPTIQRVCACKR